MDTDSLINNMVKRDIINTIKRLKKCHSKNLYDNILSDLFMLYDLADNLKIYDKPLSSVEKSAFKYDSIYSYQKNLYIKTHEFNSELTENYINLFFDYLDQNFEYNVDQFSYKDSQMLVNDFLIQFDKNIYNVFKKCVISNRFIYLQNKEEDITHDGLIFFGHYFKPYILIEDYDSIFTALTCIHEVGHLYDFTNLYLRKNNYVEEIYSHFLELVFGDYLIDNKIDCKNIKYNYFDCLEAKIIDLYILLDECIITNLDYTQKFDQIYHNLKYTYGMILALEFYNIYLKDKELGMYYINDFSNNKNYFNNPFDVMRRYKFSKEKIKKGKNLEKYLKRI